VLVIEAWPGRRVLMLSELPDGRRSWPSSRELTKRSSGARSFRATSFGVEEVLSFRTRFGKMAGKATIDGKVACEATLTCMIVPRAVEAKRAETGSARPGAPRQKALRPRVSIHPSAIVAPGAVVPASCTVGPIAPLALRWCWARIGVLLSHVVLDGRTASARATPFIPSARSALRPRT